MVNHSIGKPPCLGKLKNYEDEDDCSTDFETEFPAIVLDSTLTAIHSEPTVCPPNDDEVDFRISLDESNNEDYTEIFDENSFSYKIISVNDLKMDSGSDKPLSPNPTIDYFDDLDYFKDFENEFPAVVYNDGLTFKSDLEIKPLVSSERINEFNLINEASLSEYDEEIVLYFNVLFNIVHPDDSQLEKDNDDNDIGIIQSSEVADQRHPLLRYQIEEYNEGIRHRSGSKVEDGIFWRGAIGVHEMSDIEMGLDVADTLCFQLGGQEMEKARFGAYWDGSDILIPDKGDLRDYWIEISSDRNFMGPAPFYVLIQGPVRRLCHKMIAYSVSGRGQAPEKNQDWQHAEALVNTLFAQGLILENYHEQNIREFSECFVKTSKKAHNLDLKRRHLKISKISPIRRNSQVKDNKIHLLVQQYEQFTILEEESIDSGFARFNTIITSLKALDGGLSSKNYVRKFLRALHPKWRAKVTMIEESKDLSSLALYELVGNLKVHEVVMEKDSKIYRGQKERVKSIALKAKKDSSDDDTSTSGSNDEEYAMAIRNFKKFFKRKGKCVRCGDPNHLIGDFPKPSRNNDQKVFIGGFWSDSENDAEDKTNDETCLMAQSSNKVTLNSSYYSDNASSIDNDTIQIEYDSLCEISLKIINKNKTLKTKRALLEKEVLELNEKIMKLKRSKEIDIVCKYVKNSNWKTLDLRKVKLSL
ncbi:hypothetical protein Tco_1336217 [Tanacetum coccineum]